MLQLFCNVIEAFGAGKTAKKLIFLITNTEEKPAIYNLL